MNARGPNWQEIALTRKRPGQICMRAGVYEAVDVISGATWHDKLGQPYQIDMDKGQAFPMLPWKGLAWQRIEDEDE